jgi:hypothetical protein
MALRAMREAGLSRSPEYLTKEIYWSPIMRRQWFMLSARTGLFQRCKSFFNFPLIEITASTCV